MKAITYKKYGGPEVLNIEDVETPTTAEDEILVRVKATTVTPVDCTFRSGNAKAARLFTGLTQPKNPILGSEFSGIVEEVGEKVTAFKKGDRVFGGAEKCHAEYVCLKADAAVVQIPSDMAFEEAAAVPYGVLTALPFLRDTGSIKAGDKLLVIGASGSVGSYAVQIAKIFGAEVTGVCSTANVKMVKSLGADHVIDYKKEDFTTSGKKWEIIFDAVGKSSFSKSKNVLTENGIYLTTVMSGNIQLDILRTSFTSKKAKIALTGLRKPEEMRKDLQFVKGLLENGKIKVMIDQVYPFEEIPTAHEYVDKGHKKGNVVIRVDQ